MGTCLICCYCSDMAEKEETKGRCPACHTRYDKDMIVKMAATCDRTVADKNAEKKQKAQRVKPKAAPTATTTSTVESKKHLATIRVIQRNLVYIIGLPAHLCNESVLERREYFGHYGKVLKVLVSRPTGPPSQQASANSSISVVKACLGYYFPRPDSCGSRQHWEIYVERQNYMCIYKNSYNNSPSG
ncbi:RNA binding (RRM/RBD/RNP motifs) family protein [Zea mays]|uniref:RNA binding (RRM/RBD/RNP motifs) family protein n=1 Tax=Zea mays TaxID=4577 RepID=A0A1D6J1F7_MAIZE|nr:RNA binding (RRM/RBD/RNP motifs) family protein [Zea mays]